MEKFITGVRGGVVENFMRVGIYNRWLHTMGGGEREMAAFAQALAVDHDADLLTHHSAKLDDVAGRLNLHLPSVKLRTFAIDPEYTHVISASAEYDLFLNMSHGDLFAPRARHNLLRVFFPEPPVEQANDDGASSLQLQEGFYHPEAGVDRTFAWTGPIAKARLSVPNTAHRRRSPRLRLILHGWRPTGAKPASVRLTVDGGTVASRILPRDGKWIEWSVRLPRSLGSGKALEITLETTSFNPRALGVGEDGRDLGVALAALWLDDRSWWNRKAEPGSATVPDEAAYLRMRAEQGRSAAAGYDRLLANSRFTQRWIERRWALPSEVLYPPVDVESLAPAAKRSSILSVGRFFAGSHNKKHRVMVEAFRALCDAGLRGWEYHLVGGCDDSMPEHRAYLEEVRTAAAGYPIRLHVNAPFSELQRLYGEAQIFWHATGFGEDEEQHPERFEHFGISTVEAMAAGCVPVVFAGGGQLEIVVDGVHGFVWRTPRELQEQTQALAGDAEARLRMAEVAIARSRDFDTARFERRLHELLEEFRDATGATRSASTTASNSGMISTPKTK